MTPDEKEMQERKIGLISAAIIVGALIGIVGLVLLFQISLNTAH